jgi:hypothetical protein
MKRLTFALCCACALGAPLASAAAAEPVPAYDDPAVHFAPPNGWEKIDVGSGSGGGSEPPAAVFVSNPGKYNERRIVLEIAPYSGTLDGFVSTHESELRTKYDGAFIDHKARVTLANGMPAWWMRVSFGATVGHFYRRYEYVVLDGQRSIILSDTSRLGEVEEKDAQGALGTLSVVVYPRGR